MKSELIGAWILNEWTTAGGPDQFEYLELGPGRGTLAKDVIRTIQQLLIKLEKTDVKINMNLLEISARVKILLLGKKLFLRRLISHLR